VRERGLSCANPDVLKRAGCGKTALAEAHPAALKKNRGPCQKSMSGRKRRGAGRPCRGLVRCRAFQAYGLGKNSGMVSKPHTELIRQRRQLSAWLHEWNLEQRLRRVDMGAHEPAPESALTSAPLRAYPRRGEFAPGRILLMPPRSSISPARPLFILLLAELKSGVCLIAPFSRFSAPALPGEWRTGHKAAPLRVLCPWNARGVLRSVLETAWPAARMSAVKTRRALAIWRCIWQEDAAPGAPSRNTGPPLRHPLDPRHEYIAE